MYNKRIITIFFVKDLALTVQRKVANINRRGKLEVNVDMVNTSKIQYYLR